jgi:hypothetical protein
MGGKNRRQMENYHSDAIPQLYEGIARLSEAVTDMPRVASVLHGLCGNIWESPEMCGSGRNVLQVDR